MVLISDIKHSPIITKTQQLELFIKSEKTKRGINKPIEVQIVEEEFAGAGTSDDGIYVMKFDTSVTEYEVKHELSHISKGHCDKIKGMNPMLRGLYYYFWAEPQAVFSQ